MPLEQASDFDDGASIKAFTVIPGAWCTVHGRAWRDELLEFLLQSNYILLLLMSA